MARGSSRLSLAAVLLLARGPSLWAADVLPGDRSAAVGRGRPSPTEIAVLFDDVVPRELADTHAPGMVVAVVSDTGTQFAKGYGLSDVAAGVPVSPAVTQFRVGSISKTVTATAAMQLVEQGRLALDHDVNEYLPPPGVPATFARPITPFDLLTHTSGLDERFLSAREVADIPGYLRYLLPDRLLSPGGVIRYSNSNLDLVGWAVETVSREPFAQYVSRHVLEPLEMKRSSFVRPAQGTSDIAQGYRWENGALQVVPRHADERPSPSSSFVTTANDLARFMQAHLAGGRLGPARVLEPSSVERMHTRQFTMDPRADGVCFGFFERRMNGLRTLEHSGRQPGWMALMVLVPSEGLGLFLSVNSGTAFEALEAAERAFFDRFYPPAPLDAVRDAAPAPDEARALAGTYRGNYYPSRTVSKLVLLTEGGHELRIEEAGGRLAVVAGPRRFELRRTGEREYVDPFGQQLLFAGSDEAPRLITGAAVGDRLAWWETIALQLKWLACCLLVLLSFVAATTVRAVYRAVRGAPPASAFERRAEGLALAASASALAMAVVAALLLLHLVPADFMNAVGPVPAWLKAVLALPFATALLTPAALACAALAWRRSSWGVVRRAHYTLVALALAGTSLWFQAWNLLGWRY